METLNPSSDFRHILCEGTFCDLYIDYVPGNLVLLRQTFYPVCCIAVTEICSGQIHRHRNNRLAGFSETLKIPANLFEHIQIHLENLVDLFQYRNEMIRENHTMNRINPSYQCLRTAETSG